MLDFTMASFVYQQRLKSRSSPNRSRWRDCDFPGLPVTHYCCTFQKDCGYMSSFIPVAGYVSSLHPDTFEICIILKYLQFFSWSIDHVLLCLYHLLTDAMSPYRFMLDKHFSLNNEMIQYLRTTSSWLIVFWMKPKTLGWMYIMECAS